MTPSEQPILTEPIEITDEFTEPYGEFTDYTAINLEQNEALQKQKHVDIRSFVSDLPSAVVTMYYMDSLSMADLLERPLSTFSEGRIVVINNEGWTNGIVGPQEDRNMWSGIELSVPKEIETSTQSIIKQNG